MRSGPSGGMIVSNTEELSSVVTSATALAYSVKTAPLIPGNMLWLGGVSRSFSKFRWIKLRLFYLPVVGTTTAGRIAMSLLYDGTDLAPASMSAIIAGNRATFGPLWAGQSGFDSTNPFANHSDMIHLDLDCSKLSKRYYPFTTGESYNALDLPDRTIYSPADVVVGTEGAATSQTVGSLYVSYEIELLEPVTYSVNT